MYNMKIANATLPRDVQKSLESFLDDHKELIFPNNIMTSSTSSIDKLIGAFRVYRYLIEFLRNNRKVFIYDDVNMMEYLSGTYVAGFGTTDISADTPKPMLTGSMLLLENWDFIDDELKVTDLDIPGMIAIIAEVAARHRRYPYDVTCMQTEDYMFLKSVLDPVIGDSKNMSMYYTEDKHINSARDDNPNNHFRWRPVYRKCMKMRGAPDIDHTVFRTGDDGFVGDMDFRELLEDRVFLYVPGKDYYTTYLSAYEARTIDGDRIYEEELR